MQGFRKFLRGTGGKVLLAVIIIPFVITAFYGYFTGSGGSEVVAKVEGNAIYWGQVEQETSRMQQRLAAQVPGVDQRTLDQLVRPPMALETLINEALTLNNALAMKLDISEAQTLRYLAQLEDFQENGRFSSNQLERIARNLGYTSTGLLRVVGRDLLQNQWRMGLLQTEFALPNELQELRRLGEQERDVEYALVNVQSLAAEQKISDEQLQEYYSSNGDEFVLPEHFVVQYLELGLDAIEDVEVTESDIQAAYQARREIMERDDAGSERRRVAHIFIDAASAGSDDAARTKLREIKDAIDAGEIDFATAAREYSEDSASAGGAGQLGLLAKQDLPEELAQVAFSLEQNVVSEPVESEEGFHLLLVEDIQSKRSSFASYEEMKEILKDELYKIKAESLLFDKVGQLEELAFEHSDLAMPAEILGLELKVSEPFSLQQPFGPFSHYAALDELAAPEVRNGVHNSRLLEVGEDSYFVFHVEEVIPAQPIPLEEVAEMIRGKLALRQASAILAEQKQQLEQALLEGQAFGELVTILNAEAQQVEGLQRGDTEPNAALTDFVFSIQRASEDSPMMAVRQLNTGDLAVINITAVRDGEVEFDAAEQQQALAILARMEGQYMEQLLVGALRERGKVKRYTDRFNSLQSRGSNDEFE